jgi:hypothetical protein
MFRRPDDTPEHYRYYAAPAAVFISGYGIAKVSCVSAITLLQRSTFMIYFKCNITSQASQSIAVRDAALRAIERCTGSCYCDD